MNEKFKKLLYAKGLTQTTLAQILNISKQAIGLWVNGTSRPSAALLPKVAASLDMNSEELAEYFV